MPLDYFRGKPGRFGKQIAYVQFSFPATPFTANSTVTYQIPTPPGKSRVERLSVQCTTVGSDADGTLVLRLFKRQASDDVRTQLNADFNLEGLTTRERQNIAVQGSVSEAGRRLKDGGNLTTTDTLEIDLVSNSAAIDTQPTNVQVCIEISVSE